MITGSPSQAPPVASPVAVAAGGAVLGAVATAVTAAATRGHAATPVALRTVTNAAVGAGVALLANVASSGRIGDFLVESTWGRRHELGFALRHVLQPGIVIDTYRSGKDAEAMQRERWGPANHNDDAVDAMRHSYAAGLLAARLVHDRGLSTDAAQAITVEAGHAHEMDGVDHHERTAGRSAISSAMDEHNNAAGARVGAGLAEQLGAVPSSDTLLEALRTAAGAGELIVIDQGAPRATTSTDVPAWLEP